LVMLVLRSLLVYHCRLLAPLALPVLAPRGERVVLEVRPARQGEGSGPDDLLDPAPQ
jgi:hypothetical protein